MGHPNLTGPLTERMREAVRLVDERGMTRYEAAEAMGVGTTRIDQLLKAGRARMGVPVRAPERRSASRHLPPPPPRRPVPAKPAARAAVPPSRPMDDVVERLEARIASLEDEVRALRTLPPGRVVVIDHRRLADGGTSKREQIRAVRTAATVQAP